MMMRNGNKVLVIGLVLLAGFASSASAVTKGMKKVVEDALDFSVRQSMSMFGEMKDQKGILPRTAKDGEMIPAIPVGGQVVSIPVRYGIVMSIAMIRR